MYERILFPTDGSDAATTVFENALDVAAAHDATVTVLNVADTSRDSVTNVRGDVVDALERAGDRIVDETASRARERGVSVETDVVQGRPAATIVDYADSVDADLVVLPTHGRRGLERVLLGSVTERVVNTATVPVLTVSPDAAGDALTYPWETVLVPTDGSRGADLALDAGIDAASASGARLVLLHVVETATLGIDVRSAAVREEVEERGTELLEAAAETAREAGVADVETALVDGRPHREIRSFVEANDVDAVVMGTHGETDFSRFALGGVSAKFVRSAPVPVLLVREPAADEG